MRNVFARGAGLGLAGPLLLLIGSAAALGPGALAQTLPGAPPPGPAAGAQTGLPDPNTVVPPPKLLQPVAPGTVQMRPALTQAPVGGAPQLWTFAHPKAEAVNPVSVRLVWQSREGATHYRVYRDNAMLAELPADPARREYLDNSLSPGQRVNYVVQAVRQGAARTAALPAALASGSARLVNAQPLPAELETSQPAGAVTPSLDAPRDFSISLPNRNSNQVRVTWSAPKWATGVEILRDGVPLSSVQGAETSFDDGAPSGVRRYALRTLYAPGPGKAPFASAPSAELSLRIGPLTMVAFGDSIMWGQGLADEAKFTARVRDALQGTLGLQVRLLSFAHSGAILRHGPGTLPAIGQQEASGFNQSQLFTQGEIPNHYPTILHQLNFSAANQTQPPLPRDLVDLVLIDGCINDVGVKVIINPTRKPADVANLGRAACSGMAAMLQRVREIFPKAMIVVTGYYPIASEQSDLSALSKLVATVAGTAALAAPLVGVPADPVSAVAVALIGMEAFKSSVIANSTAFATASDAALAAAVRSIDAIPGSSGMVAFASPGFGPANAYGAPSSWLWLIPELAPAAARDDVMAQRSGVCNTPGVLATAQGAPFKPVSQTDIDIERPQCINASMGHPNRAGAQAYANAIMRSLQARIAHWRDEFAPIRRAR